MDPSSQQPLVWQKAKKSTAQGDNCVEIARLPGGGRAVRDSKDPEGPVLRFTAGEWDAFRAGVVAGEFD